MGRVCSFPGCKSGSANERNCNKLHGIKNKTMFKFPRMEKFPLIRQTWEGYIGRKAKDTEFLCELHFKSEKIQRNYEIILSNSVQHLIKRGKVTLDRTAIPENNICNESHAKGISCKRQKEKAATENNPVGITTDLDKRQKMGLIGHDVQSLSNVPDSFPKEHNNAIQELSAGNTTLLNELPGSIIISDLQDVNSATIDIEYVPIKLENVAEENITQDADENVIQPSISSPSSSSASSSSYILPILQENTRQKRKRAMSASTEERLGMQLADAAKADKHAEAMTMLAEAVKLQAETTCQLNQAIQMMARKPFPHNMCLYSLGYDDTDEKLESIPRKKSKKYKTSMRLVRDKMSPLPSFSSLPDAFKSASSVPTRKFALSVSNEVVNNDKNIKNSPLCTYTTYNTRSKIAKKVSDQKIKDVNANKTTQNNFCGKNIKVSPKKTLKEKIFHGNKNSSHKKNEENIRFKSNATSTPDKTYISKPSCSKILQKNCLQGNANNDIIMIQSSGEDDDHNFYDDREEDIFNIYKPHVNHVSRSSDSNSEADEDSRIFLDRSIRNRTNNSNEEELKEDDTVQINRNTKANEKKTDIIALLKQMYEKITKIEQRQANMKNDLEKIKQLVLPRTETLTYPIDLPKLPLRSYADSQRLEEKMYQEETKKDYVIKKLCLAAKDSNDRKCAKRVMEKLMSNHVGTFYNWQGSGGKKDAFKNTIMMETVRLAIKKLRPNVNMDAAEDSIKVWLKSRKFAVKNNAVANNK